MALLNSMHERKKKRTSHPRQQASNSAVSDSGNNNLYGEEDEDDDTIDESLSQTSETMVFSPLSRNATRTTTATFSTSTTETSIQFPSHQVNENDTSSIYSSDSYSRPFSSSSSSSSFPSISATGEEDVGSSSSERKKLKKKKVRMARMIERWASMSRFKFFWVVCAIMAIYQFLPSLFAPMLSAVSLLCYFGTKNGRNGGSVNWLKVLGSAQEGLGFLSFSFDWSVVGNSKPITTPVWALLNQIIGGLYSNFHAIIRKFMLCPDRLVFCLDPGPYILFDKHFWRRSAAWYPTSGCKWYTTSISSGICSQYCRHI